MTGGQGKGEALKVYLVAGEESGDQLGAGLMRGLSERLGDVVFCGVGGSRMSRLGLSSLFPISDLSHNGLTAIIANIPQILARMRETVADIVRTGPDVLVVIDSPDFNLRVARRVRALAPSMPIIDFVSPTVWAWRPWRAPWMAGFIDHVLALLPFEPEVYRTLGGPPCTYVGHPIIERIGALRPAPGERPPLTAGARPTLLVLPGSRRSEVSRLLVPFGETVARIVDRVGPIEILIPAVPHLAGLIREGVSRWPLRPEIIEGEEEKFAAFRRAHAALACSGTVTLELALAAVPMVVAYRADPLAKLFKPLVTARSVVLSNLVLGSNIIPEFINKNCTPARLASALEPLLSDGPERAAQLSAFDRLDELMSLGDSTPTARAAAMVVAVAGGPRAQRRLEIGT